MAFAGCNVSFHEIPTAKKKALSEVIQKNGGNVLYILGKATTHVITTPTELTSNSYKLQKAKASNITLVTEKWVDESLSKHQKQLSLESRQKGKIEGEQRREEREVRGIPNTSFYTSFSLPPTLPPTISLALPSSGPSSGDFTVALFGLNFDPSSKFTVRIQSPQKDIVNASSYEFHSSTSLVCHIPPCVMMEGKIEILASNDGIHFGLGLPFTLLNPMGRQGAVEYGSQEDIARNMNIIRSQLDNVRRAVLNIQRMELQLTSQLSLMGGPSANVQYSDGDHRFTDRALSISPADHASPLSDNIADEVVAKPKRLMDRELRLFISSTFKDLQQERDLIIRKVIPQIKRICAERDIVFSYVDLRWGITEAQSSQSTQILMCLRELQRSNLFIGILGERYGQCIPNETGAPLSSVERQEKEALLKSFQFAAKEFPWVDHFKDRSITEIEMRYVLGAEEIGTEGMPSWFFLRDPYYFEDLPQKERANHASENDYASNRVSILKEDIVNSGNPCYNYRRPVNICEIILENIRNHIDTHFPEENDISPFDKEKFRHDVTRHYLTRLYIPNEDLFHSLDLHVSGSQELPLVVTGASGGGKSALLANWVQGHKAHHPEDVVIEHYIGSSSSSTHHVKAVLRIMQEMRRELQIASNSPLSEIDFDENNQMERIITEFPVWLNKVMCQPNQRRVILIVDGLNKLTSEGAGDLIWLPRSFPPNLRVILSSSTGQSLCNKVLSKRQVPSFELPTLSFGLRKQLCRKYLAELRGKYLNDQQEIVMSECPQSANPRFLLTLLDDICVTAVHEDLTPRIQRAVQAEKIANLYVLILQRIETDYDPHRRGHIKCFLCLIWASRKGLMLSSEVIPLLTSHYKGLLNEDDLGAVYMLIDEFFTNSGGLLNFSNDDIREAVQQHYLKDIPSQKAYHRQLSAFFTEMRSYDFSSPRILDELPYQLEKADDMEKLFELLCDIRIIDQLYSPVYKYDFVQYCRAIESCTPHRVEESYRVILKTANFPPSIIRADLVYKVGLLLQEMSKYRGAEEIFLFAKLLYENSSSTLEVAKVCYALGDLSACQEKWGQAETYFLDALRAHAKEAPESEDSVRTMERLGTLYTNTSKIAQAKEILERALSICESRFGSENDLTADVIYCLGCIYFIEGKSGLGGIDQEKAETWLRRSLEIKERILGDWHPEVARVLNRLGSIYLELVQFNDAEACFRQALLIREEKLGPNHSRCLQSHKLLLSCYEMQEKWTLSIESACRALDISFVLFGEFSPASSNILLRLGDLYFANNQKSEGRGALEKAIKIREKVFGDEHVATIEARNALQMLTTPPPPPPPRNAPPPPPICQWAKPQVAVPKAIVSPLPGGIPPPPPPPSLYTTSKITKITNYDLAVGIQQINLKKQEQKYDRSDASKQYRNMAGLNKRKIELKSDKKTRPPQK